MGTKGKRILAAVLLAALFPVLFSVPAEAEERYLFHRRSVKILKDITGMLKKENLKETLSRQKKIAADLEKIRKISESDFTIAAAIMDCWENGMVNENYPFIIYGGGEYAPELEDSGIAECGKHAFVVMGYALSKGRMQPELKGRCDAAAAAARSWPDSIIICTGGATGGHNPENHTEAGEMKAYLTGECGIDPGRVFTDTEAKITVDNALNSLEIMKEHDVHACTVVTSYFHQRWSQMLFRTMAAISMEEGYPMEIIANYNYKGNGSLRIETGRGMALNQLDTMISRFGTVD